MGRLFRFSLVAAVLVAISGMAASADIGDGVRLRVYKKFKPGAANPGLYTMTWRGIEGVESGMYDRICTDTGNGCQPIPPLSDSTYVGLRGRVQQVDGGFLVSCEMMTPAYQLSTGEIVHDRKPTAGMVVRPDTYVVVITESSEYPQLNNVVIDYTGSVVDNDLMVTRFVAVR